MSVPLIFREWFHLFDVVNHHIRLTNTLVGEFTDCGHHLQNLGRRHSFRILHLKQDEKVSELFLRFVFEVWHTHVFEGNDLAGFDNFALLGCNLKRRTIEMLDTKFNA